MSPELQLFELHDLARERGIDGYRRLSKTELLQAIGELPPPPPTAVTAVVRDGLAVLTLSGPGNDNALSLETLQQLAQLRTADACRFHREAVERWRPRGDSTAYLRRRGEAIAAAAIGCI